MLKWRQMKWTGHVARIGDVKIAYCISMGKPEQKRPLQRLSRRREDNIKTDLWEIVCEGVDWTHQIQDRDKFLAVVNTAINFRGISWLVAILSASQEVLYAMELVSSLILCLLPAFTLVSHSAYSWTLKMEAICSSETDYTVLYLRRWHSS
jgi:hypothetical protein